MKKKVSAEDVYQWAARVGTFTTKAVAKKFKVKETSARALVAVLRIRRVIERHKDTDGNVSWVTTSSSP